MFELKKVYIKELCLMALKADSKSEGKLIVLSKKFVYRLKIAISFYKVKRQNSRL